METKEGNFKCPRCGAENLVASLSSSTHYSTWIKWQKREDKWIIGYVGNPIWWWDVFNYIHEKNGDIKCWDIRGGSTEENWIKGHYTWICQRCNHHCKTFKDFIENPETLDDENDNEYDIY